MNAVGFSPKHPVDYEMVKEAVRELMKDPCCDTAGAVFMETRLRTAGIVARPVLVKRALRELDPDAHKRRAKDAAKLRCQYNVKGPRSLYHCDGHEKLAKLWNIWIHGCIDGYSRFLVYL